MGKSTAKRRSTGLVGSMMWFWIVVLVGTLVFRFTGIVDVETPLGMLKALAILTGAYFLIQFLMGLLQKPE